MTLRPYSATLQAAYRDTLGTPGAPETIDDSQPVVPVAVVAQVNTASTAGYTQVTDGTDTINVTSIGGLITGGTPKSGVVVGANTGATIYTPTAGTTFYCTGYSISSSANSITQLVVNATNVSSVNLTALQPFGMNAGGQALSSATNSTPVTVVHTGGAGTHNVSIYGFEI